MIAVSVIVPIHNSQRYIQECMDSIIGQTLKELEIICVDSSSDGTKGILTEYQKKDKRVLLINDENSSYGYKLNLGIGRARGEYIAIVETDDYIAEDMMERLYHTAKGAEVDFVKGNYEGFCDSPKGRIFCHSDGIEETYCNRVVRICEERSTIPFISYNIWTGIYRTAFLREKNIYFNESRGASYQDIGFACLVLMTAEKCYFLRDGFYKYRMDNEGSSVKSNEKYKCIPQEFMWIEEQMRRLNCTTEEDRAFFRAAKLISYYWNYKRLSKQYRMKLLEYVAKEHLGFNEEFLTDMNMLDAEHIIKMYDGDFESIQLEEQKEIKKQNVYKRLRYICNTYPRLVIVCYGKYGKSVYKFIQLKSRESIVSVCDNRAGEEKLDIDGVEVINIKIAVQRNPEGFFIIANKKDGMDLKCQIKRLGIKEEQIYVCDCIAPGIELFEDVGRYCDIV